MGKLTAFNFIAPYTLDQGLNYGICIHIRTLEKNISYAKHIWGTALKFNARHEKVCMMLTCNFEES